MIQIHVKTLPCLGVPSNNTFKIAEIDASEIGFGRILKQLVSPGFDFTLDPGILLNLIIVLLRKKLFPLFYALLSSKLTCLIKNFY